MFPTDSEILSASINDQYRKNTQMEHHIQYLIRQISILTAKIERLEKHYYNENCSVS